MVKTTRFSAKEMQILGGNGSMARPRLEPRAVYLFLMADLALPKPGADLGKGFGFGENLSLSPCSRPSLPGVVLPLFRSEYPGRPSTADCSVKEKPFFFPQSHQE